MEKTRYYGVFVIVCAFLFLEYALRVSDSVLVPQLSKAFHLNAAGMGLLSSSYYIVYVLMQIPAGLLIDRFGLKHCVTFAASTVAFGAILMTLSQNEALAITARMLMGAGSSFAFLATIKVIRIVMPTKRMAFWVGIAMTIATLGATFGQGPWLALTNKIGDWRVVYYMFSMLTVTTALMMWLSSSPGDFLQFTFKEIVRNDLKQFLSRKNFWIIALYVGLLSAPITAFVAFWSIPFFTQGWGMSQNATANLLSLSWIGGLVGGPMLGYIADKFNIRKMMLVFVGLTVSALMFIVLYSPLSPALLTILIMLIGLLCNGNVIVFAMVSDSAGQAVTGFATGLTNMFNMGAGSVLQIVIGVLLVRQQESSMFINYTLQNYQHSLVIIPALLAVLTVILLIAYRRRAT